jgi:hypothetical protein
MSSHLSLNMMSRFPLLLGPTVRRRVPLASGSSGLSHTRAHARCITSPSAFKRNYVSQELTSAKWTSEDPTDGPKVRMARTGCHPRAPPASDSIRTCAASTILNASLQQRFKIPTGAAIYRWIAVTASMLVCCNGDGQSACTGQLQLSSAGSATAAAGCRSRYMLGSCLILGRFWPYICFCRTTPYPKHCDFHVFHAWPRPFSSAHRPS